MSEEKNENAPEIKKVSENVYINVSKIKSEDVDLDGDSEDENNSKTAEEKSEEDRNKGDETVGIP